MEAIIHPGMPKTGSSSIQATLVSAKPEGWILPDTPTGNMSGQFVLFFEDAPQDHHSFKSRGLSAAEIEKDRVLRFTQFEKKLQEGAEEGLKSIFTAERISLAPGEAVEKLAALYRKYNYDVKIIAYVRKPVSFMQSAFQQGLKINIKKLNEGSMHWPRYRDRFEKFDQIFGKENVKLSLFDPAEMRGGDVCLDFFEKAGINLLPEQVVRVNESMSLTACALLFAQRNRGEGFVQGFKAAPTKNNAFISTLGRLPGPPLRFKRSLVEPLLEKWKEDIDWMEDRLGISLVDLPIEDSPDAIGSEDELLSFAQQNSDVLEGLILNELKKEGAKPLDRVVRNVELLRNLHY